MWSVCSNRSANCWKVFPFAAPARSTSAHSSPSWREGHSPARAGLRTRPAVHRPAARVVSGRAGFARYRAAPGDRRGRETGDQPRSPESETAPRPPGAAHATRSAHARGDVTETCNEVIEFLDAYVAEELDPGTRPISTITSPPAPPAAPIWPATARRSISFAEPPPARRSWPTKRHRN